MKLKVIEPVIRHWDQVNKMNHKTIAWLVKMARDRWINIESDVSVAQEVDVPAKSDCLGYDQYSEKMLKSHLLSVVQLTKGQPFAEHTNLDSNFQLENEFDSNVRQRLGIAVGEAATPGINQ